LLRLEKSKPLREQIKTQIQTARSDAISQTAELMPAAWANQPKRSVMPLSSAAGG